MELHRFRAEEEPGPDLFVRKAFGSGERHLQLLRRQLLVRGPAAPTQPRSARPELGARPLAPGPRPERLKCLERRVQVVARRPALSQAPQALAVRKLGPRSLELVRILFMELERRLERFLGVGVVGEQRAKSAHRRRDPNGSR